jgi:predicted nucleotidyltransferase
MKKLRVDLDELALAFENSSWEMSYYLDLEPGQVIWISDETRAELEELYEEAYEPEGDEEVDLAEALQDSDLHEWQKELVLEADRVETGYGSRYIAVPRADSSEAYRDMEDFIATVKDERMQDRLWQAIEGRGAFRRFKDLLADHPRERERWFAFKGERTEKRMLDWLESEGVEAIIPAPAPAEELEPPAPMLRLLLLAETLAFVQAARRLAGVTRIALIGSLASEEPDPMDADLLVTVAEGSDLAPLATLGRKLQGHAQSFNRGGEVFLADPQGHYLGRTCPWKECGPGIRLSCDALHCGRRPYLHDDLEAIRLPGSLIAAPPIELWPRVVARVLVPEDVEQALLAPLRKEEGNR